MNNEIGSKSLIIQTIHQRSWLQSPLVELEDGDDPNPNPQPPQDAGDSDEDFTDEEEFEVNNFINLS